jgi:hypothetical protein
MMSRMTRVRYRMWQLWRALTGRLDAQERVFAAQILTPPEYRLYQAMPSYDQRHTMDVALLLGRLGVNDHSVLAMALLHDVGKLRDDGRPLGIGWYGVGVLTRPFPTLQSWLARWCEPLRRSIRHEQRSVAIALQGGARATVVTSLQRLAAGEADSDLLLFRQADDQC